MPKSSAQKQQKPPAKRLPRQQRELQMLEVAAVEFGRKGFDATSMDDIAAACGVTKPMLYNYFKSKEGLYAAMINRAGSYLVNAIIAVREEKDPVKRLHAAMGVFMDFVDQYRDSWRMVFGGKGAAETDQMNIAGYRQQVMVATVYTLAELRPATLDKALARQRVEPLAYGLLGAGEAIAQWWLAKPEVSIDEAKASISKVIDATVKLVKKELAGAK